MRLDDDDAMIILLDSIFLLHNLQAPLHNSYIERKRAYISVRVGFCVYIFGGAWDCVCECWCVHDIRHIENVTCVYRCACAFYTQRHRRAANATVENFDNVSMRRFSDVFFSLWLLDVVWFLFKSACLFWLCNSVQCNAIGVKETCVWTTTEITGRNSMVLVWDCCLFYDSTFATRKPSGLRTMKGKIHACANVTQYKSNERRNILSFFVYFTHRPFPHRHPYARSLIILLFSSFSFSLFLSPFPSFSFTMYWQILYSYFGRNRRRYSDILHETCTHWSERVTFKMQYFKNSQCAIETWK